VGKHFFFVSPQIRKFLGLSRKRKSANFCGVPVRKLQIRKLVMINPQNYINKFPWYLIRHMQYPQKNWVRKSLKIFVSQIANLQISTFAEEKIKSFFSLCVADIGFACIDRVVSSSCILVLPINSKSDHVRIRYSIHPK
jgi:hypothetical protein